MPSIMALRTSANSREQTDSFDDRRVEQRLCDLERGIAEHKAATIQSYLMALLVRMTAEGLLDGGDLRSILGRKQAGRGPTG
jgi:hypothetical protein